MSTGLFIRCSVPSRIEPDTATAHNSEQTKRKKKPKKATKNDCTVGRLQITWIIVPGFQVSLLSFWCMVFHISATHEVSQVVNHGTRKGYEWYLGLRTLHSLRHKLCKGIWGMVKPRQEMRHSEKKILRWSQNLFSECLTSCLGFPIPQIPFTTKGAGSKSPSTSWSNMLCSLFATKSSHTCIN